MNIRIRPLEEADTATSVHWRNDPEIWRHTGSAPDHFITHGDELEWVRRVTADESGRRFAILADEVYVGNIYLTDIDGRRAQYHIFLGDKRYWGKGVATAATRQIVEFALKKLDLNQIYLEVSEDNAAAVHLYSKSGFVESKRKGGKIYMTLDLDTNR